MSVDAAGIGTIVESSEHSASSTSPSTRSAFSPQVGQDQGAMGSVLLLLAADRCMRCFCWLCRWLLCAVLPAESVEHGLLLLLAMGTTGCSSPCCCC